MHLQGARNLMSQLQAAKSQSYRFHMLAARVHHYEGHWKPALEALQQAEGADHNGGFEQGEVLLLRSSCFHELGKPDLSKECLFQSAVVRLTPSQCCLLRATPQQL